MAFACFTAVVLPDLNSDLGSCSLFEQPDIVSRIYLFTTNNANGV